MEGKTQHLRTDLQQAQTEPAAARSELAESKVTLDTRLQDHTSHCVARETAVKDELQQLVSTEGSSLEHLNRHVRANNVVMHGVPDTAATSRPIDLTRFVKGKLDAAVPCRSSTPAHSQSAQVVSHVGRPGSNKRAVLVEFTTHTAKHEVFKISQQLRREGLCLADELTPKQLKAQRATDFSALKLKGFSPFYWCGQLLYRDQGITRKCKRGEAIPRPRRRTRGSKSPRGAGRGRHTNCLPPLAFSGGALISVQELPTPIEGTAILFRSAGPFWGFELRYSLSRFHEHMTLYIAGWPKLVKSCLWRVSGSGCTV